MLALPTFGLSQPTVTPTDIRHNVKLEVLCDWIEGSVLFHEEDLSTADVVDVLTDEGIYDNQNDALVIVTRTWHELRRRLEWIGKGSPFSFIRGTMKRTGSWEENPAHSFCVLVSMPLCYKDWSTGRCDSDYIEQGRLFEALTKASIENQFSDWKVHQTGWTSKNVTNLSDLVNVVATKLGEEKLAIEPWENPTGNDAGLDLLCYRPFPDNRGGVPAYLMQCASGKNWIHKLHTPVLKVWTQMIQFVVTPRKAFSVPFALLDNDFKNRCNRVDGMLLDRYRLLAAANHNKEWVPGSLKDEIIDWVAPRLKTLPLADE